ncbi:MAG TPA: tetratricopeptide repeat protein, partial [Pirellulaceae bacterium]|nr:tetratricopeptide repeat protein [Pirellulaceae bacterium]
AEAQGDRQRHEALLTEATEWLAAAAGNAEFSMRDAASFRLAWMAFQAEAWEKSAGLFAAVAEMDGSVLRSPATLLAGRAWLQAKSWDQAQRWLDQSLSYSDELSAEAAHWLCQLYLRTGRPDQALILATDWASRANRQSPMHIELLMDRAEAATAIPNRHHESIEFYLDVVRADDQHRLAPVALYQAAFSLHEAQQLDQAVALCRQFVQQYPGHNYLPDVLEVWADASLIAHDYDEARRLYDELAVREGDARQSWWSTRRGVAAFFQKRYGEAVAILEPLAERGATDPTWTSEAHYWLGCARLELKQYALAGQSFEAALRSAEGWSRAPDAALFLVQSRLADNQWADAERAVQHLWEQFPQSPQACEAAVRVAQQAPPEAAIQWLKLAVERFPDSPLMPQALYSLGRRLSQAGDTTGALSAFEQLVRDFPDDARMIDARIESAAIWRKTAQPEKARDQLAQLLPVIPVDHAQQLDALYEMALAEIALGDHAAAIDRLEAMLEQPNSIGQRDRIHYEIAWAAREWQENLARGESADQHRADIERLGAIAQEHFAKLAREFPASDLAADAWFQVGQHEYAQGRFDQARDAYQQSLTISGATDNLRERASYKLGWSLFKLKAFSEAHRAFEQQLKEFPTGALRADGMFMLSESLFAQKQYEQALAAYRAAKPVIDESDEMAAENRWFAALHAAQAANQMRDYQSALEFAQALAHDASAADSLRLDAWLEIGNAYLGLKQMSDAVEAWRKASADLGKTGVRASCMIGDALFAGKQFDEAIQQFKLVLYGYGGTERHPDLDPWKAFAAYEIARCYHVQIETASPALRPQLIEKSKEFFQYLVDHYPETELAPEAKSQLERLRRLQ